jgi:hypothetical protein
MASSATEMTNNSMIRIACSWLVAGALIAAITRPIAGAEDVKFRWAFGAITGVGGGRHFVRVTDDVTLRSGDEIQVYLSPVTKCYVYVLHEDPAHAITALFPPKAGEFPANYGVGRDYYVPGPKQWLTLDAVTGTERLYVIASRERLTKVEALLQGPRASAKAVIEELAVVLKQQRPRNWSERPVTMGGQVRGTPPLPNHPDLAAEAVEVSAPGVLARAFVIEHR